MHELALCESITRIVERARQGQPVEAVDLVIGHLRQVVPETLEHCWELVTAGTPLAGSILRIEQVPVQVRCRGCGTLTTSTGMPLPDCAGCGGRDTVVEHGTEFQVTSIDVADDVEPAVGSAGRSNG